MTSMTLDDFIALLIEQPSSTPSPPQPDQTEASRTANLTLARTMLEAFHPADATEAAAAARAVAAHFAAMDSFARAAKPGVSDEKAIRLRANAIAAGRVFERRDPGRRRQPSGTDQRTDLPARRNATPAPASQVRHRAELPCRAPRPLRRCGTGIAAGGLAHLHGPRRRSLAHRPRALIRRSALHAVHGRATGTLS